MASHKDIWYPEDLLLFKPIFLRKTDWIYRFLSFPTINFINNDVFCQNYAKFSQLQFISLAQTKQQGRSKTTINGACFYSTHFV